MADGPFDLHVYPRVEPDEAQPAGWRYVVPVGLLTPRSHGRPLRFPPGPHDGVLDRWIRSTHAHYWHLAGTCRMGPDPAKGAMVDARGRVHGVRGLRIADASVFQRLPRATAALPTAVAGERIADLILQPRSG